MIIKRGQISGWLIPAMIIIFPFNLWLVIANNSKSSIFLQK